MCFINEARRSSRNLALVFAVLAMMVQVLLPSGYMIAKSPASGTIEISLCTSQGPILALLAADGQIIKKDGRPNKDNPVQDNSQSVCAFAAHANFDLAQLSSIGTLEIFVYANRQQAISSMQNKIGLGLAAPPPPKTGPPHQV